MDRALSGCDRRDLVALHIGRALGIFFVLLHADERLPPTFALTVGRGNVFIGFAAALLAWSG